MQYAGSEEFIRSQFESYILGLISSVKLHNYMLGNNDGATLGETDPAVDFGLEWVEACDVGTLGFQPYCGAQGQVWVRINPYLISSVCYIIKAVKPADVAVLCNIPYVSSKR